MKDRDPIPIERLEELSRSNPTPEMLELLWEIRRLHEKMREFLAFSEQMSREFVEAKIDRPLSINMRRCELLNEPCTAVMYRKR